MAEELGIMSRVRLTGEACERFRDIHPASVGFVHMIAGEAVQVSWPAYRTWHKRVDLELAL